jgi:hypothetical protein
VIAWIASRLAVPQPREVTDAADRLIALYRDAQQRMLTGLADAVAGGQRTAQTRFRSLLGAVDRELDGLEAGHRDWLQSDLVDVYGLGATAGADAVGSDFTWTQIHKEAVEALARTSWDEVLAHTRYVRRASKSVIRRLAADAAARTVLGEVTASRAGEELARLVQSSTKLATVRYRDGSAHSIADWADTSARTNSAMAYQNGGFEQAAQDRIEWMEIFDGPGCCLGPGHDVGEIANGLVLSLAEARANPLSHPRCSRSASPRPDITNRTEARLASTPLADREAAAVEERARAAVANVNTPRGHFAAGRVPRTPRQPRTARV